MLVLQTFILVVLLGVATLAVEYGRLQLASQSLQSGADAAARAAASGLAADLATARQRGKHVASLNTVDGQALVLLDGDFTFGRWDTSTRTLQSASGNDIDAVGVTAVRSQARDNAIPLLFASIFGMNSPDLSRTAVARITRPNSFGIVGLDRVTLDSNARTDSYNSAMGSYSGAWSPDRGTVASNGPVILKSNSVIQGDALAGTNASLPSGGNVTGTRGNLSETLSFPPVNAAPYSFSNNNNALLPSSVRSGQDLIILGDTTVNMPAGIYYFRDFIMDSNTRLNVTGPATIYVTRNITITSNARSSAHRPQNLQLKVIGSGSVLFDSNAGFHADLYAPQSSVTFDSNVQFHGSVVAKTLLLNSNSQIHYDESLVAAAVTNIVLVK